MILLTAEIFFNDWWVKTSWQKYSKILSEDKTSNPSGKNILKEFARSKQAWTDWAKFSGQKYSKIVSEVETKMN